MVYLLNKPKKDVTVLEMPVVELVTQKMVMVTDVIKEIKEEAW
jgi:hypothetical protein